MKIKTNFLILIFFLFTGTLSPQRPNGKEEVQEKIQQEANPPQSENIWHEIEKYKDSIKISATEAEKSKKVISLNETYLKNLDKKIEEVKQKPQKNKKEEKVYQTEFSMKVYHLDSACIETRNWLGRKLNNDECKTWKIDTLWATIK